MLAFSTKAQTLALLRQNVTRSHVLPQVSFTVDELNSIPDKICKRVSMEFNDALIVRSSALTEDTKTSSQAGKFMSILNVPPNCVLDAARKVAASFADDCVENQILVQPMLTDIIMSGVVFTVDPNTEGNYFVINYDKSSSSDSVTSGEGRNLSTCYIFRGHRIDDEYLDNLIEATEEIMKLFESNNIDIEFAYTASGKLYILQVRPLIISKSVTPYQQQREALSRVHSLLENEMRPKPYVKGRRTIYGVMPDWNPAEMIGTRPRPLALSLYRKLITDGTWAYQRNNYGYKNLRSFPLMVELCGLPYIDVRVSFNSFIPKDIDDELTSKLANYYLDSLAAQPDKHDKIEFDIIFSCYTFNLPEQIKMLNDYGFSASEQAVLQESLRRLTNNIINVSDGLWIADTKKIRQLEERREIVLSSKLDKISKIYWLLEDCTRYGTLPFAGLARAGFIAVLLLKSLISIGVLSVQDYENYMRQLNTVSSQMISDRQDFTLTAFLRKYGHLRPGTYEITSPRYDSAPELYFRNTSSQADLHKKPRFSLTLEQYSEIQLQMEKHGLDGDVLALFKFLKAGIEGREYSKFVFTRSLSDALELLAQLGNEYGFSREDMAFSDISVIEKLYSSSADVRFALESSIAKGREKYAQALTIAMPPVIVYPNDIYAFHMPSDNPNFITLKDTTGEVCTDYSGNMDISGKILTIPAADPGYDWIFSHEIRGFITAFGGVNSHMAIRAGELGVPAVIGAGEKLFTLWKNAQILHIDCANKKVEILQ